MGHGIRYILLSGLFKIQLNVNFTAFTKRKKGLKFDDKQRRLCQMINTNKRSNTLFNNILAKIGKLKIKQKDFTYQKNK